MSLPDLNDYRDPALAAKLVEAIRMTADKPARLMEICGTHTVAIFRAGLRELLPSSIELISGPGCPVCVSANQDIDRALWIADQPGVIVTTFGDLLRVPGSTGSLQEKRSAGADVRMVYAAFDAVEIARENPDRQVVFIGIGFETTAPTVAAAAMRAKAENVGNFSLLSLHKVLPPALKALLESPDIRIDGLLCPGHVSTIIGAKAYEPAARAYRMPCVVAGFEPIDILEAVLMLVRQIRDGRAEVENQYVRAVHYEGNPKARAVLDTVFEPDDAVWRGLGTIPESGLKLRAEYRAFDAAARFDMPVIEVREDAACKCGQVLRGIMTPRECGLFGKGCTPQKPKGPCMVSSEGTCGAYFRYQGGVS